MNKVAELKADIEAIEGEAQALGTDKTLLYDLLIVAYYKQKDIIVGLETQQPAPVIQVDTDEVDRLTFELKELKAKFAIEEAAKDVALEQLKSIASIACTKTP